MNKLGDLLETNLVGALTEYEKERIDGVRLTGSVGTNDGGEGFVERTNRTRTEVGLEIRKFDHLDDQTAVRLFALGGLREVLDVFELGEWGRQIGVNGGTFFAIFLFGAFSTFDRLTPFFFFPLSIILFANRNLIFFKI